MSFVLNCHIACSYMNHVWLSTPWQKHMSLGEIIELFSNRHEPKLRRRHSYCLCSIAWRRVLGGHLRRMVCLCRLTVVCDGNTSNKLLHVKFYHPYVSITGIQYFIPTVSNKPLDLKANMDKDRTKETGISFFSFFFLNWSRIRIWAMPKFTFTFFLLLYARPSNMKQLLVIMPPSLWKNPSRIPEVWRDCQLF